LLYKTHRKSLTDHQKSSVTRHEAPVLFGKLLVNNKTLQFSEILSAAGALVCL